MKERIKIELFAIVILIMISCENSEQRETLTFEEKQLSFLDLRFGYNKRNKWIKKSENILMLHETFKKIGYENIISELDWNYEWNWYLDVNKSPKNLIDSLEITYHDYQIAPKYFKEFWERRIEENNQEVVYQVVSEIKRIKIEKEKIEVNQNLVNDTLERLILFEFPRRKLTDEEANQHLEYLIEIGLHESAYNLISGERNSYMEVKWNKSIDNVIMSLNRSETYKRPWFEDDSK